MKNKDVSTKLILDKRYEKKSGTYPVLLRVTFARRCAYIPAGKEFNYTDKQWEKMWALKDLKEDRVKLVDFEEEATKIIDSIPPPKFTLAEFKTQYNNKDIEVAGNAKTGTLETHFKKYEAGLWSRERVKTAYNYRNARLSLEKFKPGMLLTDITVDLLKDYQFWMEKQGRSETTISMYLRALRTIINKAAGEGEFPSDRKYYPFGEHKFKIPEPRQKKKMFQVEQLRKFIEYKPKTSEKAFAKDMFLFSYYCGGTNPVDIAKFKYSWIKANCIHFPTRSKNKNKKQDPIPPVEIDSELKKIIDKWKIKKENPETYVFGILTDDLTAKQVNEKINGFNKSINLGLRDIAKDDLKFDFKPTMGYARATQANVLRNLGVDLKIIGMGMGHASEKTTKIYLEQLPNDQPNTVLSKLRLTKLKAV